MTVHLTHDRRDCYYHWLCGAALMWGVVHTTILPKRYWRVLKGVTRERARKGYLLLVVLATAGTAMACVFLLLQNPNHA